MSTNGQVGIARDVCFEYSVSSHKQSPNGQGIYICRHWPADAARRLRCGPDSLKQIAEHALSTESASEISRSLLELERDLPSSPTLAQTLVASHQCGTVASSVLHNCSVRIYVVCSSAACHQYSWDPALRSPLLRAPPQCLAVSLVGLSCTTLHQPDEHHRSTERRARAAHGWLQASAPYFFSWCVRPSPRALRTRSGLCTCLQSPHVALVRQRDLSIVAQGFLYVLSL